MSPLMSLVGQTAPLSNQTIAFVLGGGRGSRLHELTDLRAKPEIFFGGTHRIVDFSLSNAVNSGIRRICVATQYQSHSLIRHLIRGWNFFRQERNEGFEILPASQRDGLRWYSGTADAVYQNIDTIETYNSQLIIVLAGDHVYKMNYGLMLAQHVNQKADVTVGCIAVPRESASAFGVMSVDADDHIISFSEKPVDPPPMSDNTSMSLVSMGIYVFSTRFLIEQLRRDADDDDSSHDFGKDIIPYLVQHGRAMSHPLSRSCVRSGYESEDYWRDVGTLDSYFDANIDLTRASPALDLYNRDWPIWTDVSTTPPAKFVHDFDGRRGAAISSLVSGGCIVSGSTIRNTLLCPNVHVHSHSSIDNSVILPDVDIGRGARLSKVIVNNSVRIPAGLVVGEDAILDATRYNRTPKGVCVITQTMIDRLSM